MSARVPTHARARRRLAIRLAAATGLLLAVSSVAAPVNATFPGRDGRIAVSHAEFDGDQFRRSLFTMNPDGTARTRLTQPDWGFADTSPNWSPDGTRVVFERDDNTRDNSDLYVVNADGSGLTRLTDCSSEPRSATCGGYFGPAWTPDGRSIVVARCCITHSDGAHGTIVSMAADGTGMRTIYVDPSPNGGPDGVTVSPDGQWVAFTQGVTNHAFSIDAGLALFLVHPDGTGLRQITSYQLKVDEKDWSPDGSRIVFVTHATGVGQPFRADIDTIRPDGTGLTQLTSTTPGQTFAFAPKWSPAGDRIMFDYFPAPDGLTDVYTMRPDGSDVQIVPGTARDNPTDWGTAPTR